MHSLIIVLELNKNEGLPFWNSAGSVELFFIAFKPLPLMGNNRSLVYGKPCDRHRYSHDILSSKLLVLFPCPIEGNAYQCKALAK